MEPSQLVAKAFSVYDSGQWRPEGSNPLRRFFYFPDIVRGDVLIQKYTFILKTLLSKGWDVT